MSEFEEDQIDLIDLVLAVWRRKWTVIAISTVFVAIGVTYALLAEPVYRAYAVLAPVDREEGPSLPSGLSGLASLAGVSLGGSLTDSMQAVATLRSRAFVEGFIEDRDLMPVLFADDWDASRSRWIADAVDEQPRLADAVGLFSEDVLFIKQDADTGLITLAIEWDDPAVATSWVGLLVERINEQLRTRDLADSERRLAYLNDRLSRENLIEMRQALSRLIEAEIQTITLANAEIEYGFRVIDPPREPVEPVAPNKSLIVILAGLLGGAVALLTIWVLAAIKERQLEAVASEATAPEAAT
ncbi:MAG: Wzz/FepE/Etk N-terminal domain-containing protein [Pseudomonadota bacterium]